MDSWGAGLLVSVTDTLHKAATEEWKTKIIAELGEFYTSGPTIEFIKNFTQAKIPEQF